MTELIIIKTNHSQPIKKFLQKQRINYEIYREPQPAWKTQEILAKIESWEVKRKEKLEKFEFIEAEFCHNRNSGNDKIRYSEDGSYSYNWEKCPSCQEVIKIIKSNNYGDEIEELKEHGHTSTCQASKQSNSSSENTNKNYLPWILGGVGIFALVGLVWYSRRENK